MIVCVVLALGFAVAFWHSVSANDGHAIFGLDDPYIHLAMARDVASHGVWGVTPSGFSATSSAPLYTTILSILFLITGAWPFWLWLFAAGGGLVVAIVLTRHISASFQTQSVAVALGLWAVIVAGIPETMFTGLEHAAHTLAVVWVAALLERYATKNAARKDWLLLVAVFAACGLRYEGLFMLPFVFFYLRWQKRTALAFATVGAGVLPAVVLAIMQLMHGAMLLPNTLMLKGVSGYDRDLSFITRFFRQIDSPYISVLLLIVALGVFWGVLKQRHAKSDPRLAASGMFITMAIFQSLFAQNERRYATYLVVLGIWAAIPWVSEWVTQLRHGMHDIPAKQHRLLRYAAILAVLCVALFPFSGRFQDLGRLDHIGQDIYAQQYQMAQFFATEYPGATIALNDIGTTAWKGQNGILDLWGLSDAKVARLRLRDQWTPDAIRDAAQAAGVDVAAVYPSWFIHFGGLPREWTAVGAWQLKPGLQTNSASPQVVFYATSQLASGVLRGRLRDFASQLPAGAVFTPFF